MTNWLDEGIGVNHAEQLEYRGMLEKEVEPDYDSYYAKSPDIDDDDADQQSAGHSSMALSTVQGNDDVDDAVDAPSQEPEAQRRETLEPSDKALQSLRRENQVPLQVMGESYTSNRYDGLRRSGIRPESRPMDPAYMEAHADFRNNLRPLLRKNRAIGNVREAGIVGQRTPLVSNSRWGRFKDLFRGSSLARRFFGMSTRQTVQNRRLERKLNAERLDASGPSTLFSRLSDLKQGDQARMRQLSTKAKWGGLTYRQGPSIAEVDDDDESMD